MVMVHDEAAERAELNDRYSWQREQMHWKSADEQKQRDHELSLLETDRTKDVEIERLKTEAQKAQTVLRERQITRRTIVTTIVRLPAIPVVAILIFILELLNKPTDTFENFMSF